MAGELLHKLLVVRNQPTLSVQELAAQHERMVERDAIRAAEYNESSRKERVRTDTWTQHHA